VSGVFSSFVIHQTRLRSDIGDEQNGWAVCCILFYPYDLTQPTGAAGSFACAAFFDTGEKVRSLAP